MLSHWGLSDIKSPQVSRTLLSILADLNNAVVWMVSTCPLISKSFSTCTYPLVTVPKTPITIGIIVTFMFHSFFNSLAKSRYLSFFPHSFNFTLWSAGTAKSTILLVLFFMYWLFGLVFANGPGNLGSIPGRVIPKTLKMVLDTTLLNTQQYKVRIKGKVEQSRERSSALPYTSV